ncbi:MULTISPECIES: LPS-assembly protein LptD [Dyella]|uniref:LPS-assembly protein LptD n=2 Tax=Dyella TaxID=231454 RepID=A0A4R0YPH9_9GAMM|nr:MULTISPECIES: LPS assembly protein LptD [Dyella]TBR36995.1 LPS-assembly protein LptD [Dyella terrae]TCI07915.1 LPS-assembly protein LptD [Dyella soli]
MTPKPPSRLLPPRRLIAVAAALALFGSQAEAQTAPSNEESPAPAAPTAQPSMAPPVAESCPLGSFHCKPRPLNYAMCRPNALLEFYDPALTKDTTLRETSNTEVYAEEVDSSDQTVYHLKGRVDITRADQRLRSDTADYNSDTTDYDAHGNVRYQESGQLLAAEHIKGNTDSSTGIADNVRYQMLTSRGNGTAKQGQMLDAQRTHYSQVTYSTCDVGHHLWEVRSKDLRIDKESGVGVAHGATMRFANVPFLYLPYFSFPVDDRRKSGFLYPMIGNSSRSGFMVSAPYYLNLAPNYDATLDPRYYSDRGFLLGAEFRYLNLIPGTTGQLNVEYMPHDSGGNDPNSVEDTKGDSRYLVKWNNVSHIVGPVNFSASINRASDRNYLRDFGNDLYTSSIGTLTSSAYLTAGGNHWNASFGADTYQNVDPNLPDTVVQYKRWPRATFNLNLPIERWLEFGATTEAVAFRKDDVVEGNRLDIYPYLQADFRGASWFVRPRVAYRYTGYELSSGYQNYNYYGLTTPGLAAAGVTTPFTQRSPSRSLPVVSLDTGLIFDRMTTLFGNSYTQTLEPRLYYLYVPYRNQNDIPLFDSNLMSFDYWQLFSPNQFSGADRQMNANNLTAAVTTRLLDDNGVERLSFSFGQIRYFTQQKVQLPNGYNTTTAATDFGGSDYVAQFTAQLSDDWRLNSSYQWNPNHIAVRDAQGNVISYQGRNTDVATVGLQYRLGLDGVMNFGYRYRRAGTTDLAQLEQYDVSAVYPISDRWRILGRWAYSVADKRTVEALAGIEYDSCCVAVRLVGRHYVDSSSPTLTNVRANNAIMFELQFKGLGAFNGQTEGVLRRGILGYQ